MVSYISSVEWEDLSDLKYRQFNPYAERLIHNRFQKIVNRHTFTWWELEKIGHIANLLARQVRLQTAERMYHQALAGYEKALGPDHTSTLGTVHNLGILYADQGKLAEAEQMY